MYLAPRNFVRRRGGEAVGDELVLRHYLSSVPDLTRVSRVRRIPSKMVCVRDSDVSMLGDKRSRLRSRQTYWQSNCSGVCMLVLGQES